MSMIGTMVVKMLGGPITPRPLGPSQPCAPIIHTMVSTSPSNDISRSKRERVNNSSSAAITSRASPINRTILRAGGAPGLLGNRGRRQAAAFKRPLARLRDVPDGELGLGEGIGVVVGVSVAVRVREQTHGGYRNQGAVGVGPHQPVYRDLRRRLIDLLLRQRGEVVDAKDGGQHVGGTDDRIWRRQQRARPWGRKRPGSARRQSGSDPRASGPRSRRKSSVAVVVSSEPPNSAAILSEAVAALLSGGRNTVAFGLGSEPGEPRAKRDGDSQEHEKRGDGLSGYQPTQCVKNLRHVRTSFRTPRQESVLSAPHILEIFQFPDR